MSIRIIIGGPSCSGKSTFAESITRALQNLGTDIDRVDLDLWAPTLSLISGDITKEERDLLKRRNITKSEATEAVERFKTLSTKHEIIIGDGPGGISEESKLIFESATHGIIVCQEGKIGEIEEWKQFFKEMGIPIIAIIISKLDGSEKVSRGSLIEADLINLDRTPRVTPIMIQLAYALKGVLGI